MTITIAIGFLSVPSRAAGAHEVADAAMRNNLEAVRLLIQQKADVNEPQADGTTAMHWAARWDNRQLAVALLRAGADPKVANRDAATPMFLATLNGSASMIELLLEGGVDPNAPILAQGVTPLMMA